MWVEVKVLPKTEILDVQGRAIAQTLKKKDDSVTDCRYGKCIQLHVDTKDEKLALQKIKEVAESTLYNPLTETYEIKVIV